MRTAAFIILGGIIYVCLNPGTFWQKMAAVIFCGVFGYLAGRCLDLPLGK